MKHWNFLLQAYQQQEEQLKLALTQLADNGQLIGSLQLQLSTLTGRNQEERQSLDAQFRQMELSLMTRNEECEGLVNEIRSVSRSTVCFFCFLTFCALNQRIEFKLSRRLRKWIN